MTHYAIHPVLFTDGDAVAIKDPDDSREPDAFTIYRVDNQGHEHAVGEDEQSVLEAIEVVNDFEDMTSVVLTKVGISYLIDEIDNF